MKAAAVSANNRPIGKTGFYSKYVNFCIFKALFNATISADRYHNLNFFIINVLLLSFVPVEPLYNERNLLQQISQGDEASFKAIYDRYKGKLYSYILKIADSRESAEDAVHDVFLKIWDGREKLPVVRNFGA